MEWRWMDLFYLVFILLAIFVIWDVYRSFGDYLRGMFTESKVLRTGIGVNADIVARTHTGRSDADQPIYRLTFRFKTQQGVEVHATLLRALNADGLIRYAPGNGATIKYDPNNPKRIGMNHTDKPLILGD